MINILITAEMGSAVQKSPKLENIFENFLATGNVPTSADLGLMQDSGMEEIKQYVCQCK